MKQWTDSPDPAPDSEPVAALAAFEFRLTDDPGTWCVMFGAADLDDALATVRLQFGERRVLGVRRR